MILLVHQLAYFIEKSPIELRPPIHVSHMLHNKLYIDVNRLSPSSMQEKYVRLIGNAMAREDSEGYFLRRNGKE